MIPPTVPAGDSMRDRRHEVRRMIADVVHMNPTPLELFKNLKSIDAGLTTLIKKIDQLEKGKK